MRIAVKPGVARRGWLEVVERGRGNQRVGAVIGLSSKCKTHIGMGDSYRLSKHRA
jgi:hypothetical protein